MVDILCPIAAYLLGSIPFGYLLVKWAKGIDVRTQGSGNIGMTNVWRVAGAGWGIATFLLDIAKGALAVWLAGHFDPANDLLKVICGLVALLGNIFSIFMKFKGGKGIAISVGIFVGILPLETAVGFSTFLVILGLGRMVSLGSLIGSLTLSGLALYRHGLGWFSGLAMLATVVVWWTHRQNIKRILNGTENKIGKKKK